MFLPGCFQQRYIITAFGFFLTIITSISKYSISITLTEMVNDKSDYLNSNVTSDDGVCPLPDSQMNDSNGEGKGEFNWNSQEQGIIIGAAFTLYAFLQTPCGVVAEHYGANNVLFIGQTLSGLCMIALPYVARAIGVIGVVILRVLIGVGQAGVYPCLSFLLANWIPPQEKSQLGAIVLTGETVGVIISMAVSGIILGNIENSWALTFYLYGSVTILWAVLWLKFGFDDPNSNPYISYEEKEYLKTHIKKGIEKQKLPPTPLLAMAKSPATWACLIAHFGHDWGIISITSDLPKYMKRVLHYDVEKNGLLSALPYIVLCITAIIGGWVSDFLHRRNLVSTSVSRKLLATISSVGPALGLVGVIYAGCDKTISVTMFTIGMGLMGFFYSSLGINPVDLSPNYAGTVMGIIGYGTAAGIVSPYLTGVIAKHDSLSEWTIVFGISIAMLTITDLIFVIFGSGEVQSYDKPVKTQKPKKNDLEVPA